MNYIVDKVVVCGRSSRYGVIRERSNKVKIGYNELAVKVINLEEYVLHVILCAIEIGFMPCSVCDESSVAERIFGIIRIRIAMLIFDITLHSVRLVAGRKISTFIRVAVYEPVLKRYTYNRSYIGGDSDFDEAAILRRVFFFCPRSSSCKICRFNRRSVFCDIDEFSNGIVALFNFFIVKRID